MVGVFLSSSVGEGGALSQHMVVSAPVIIYVKEENEPFFSRASCDYQ